MSIKYFDLDTDKQQKTFEKLVKKGYKQDSHIFNDKVSAETHIQSLFNSGKDVIVVSETKVIRWHVFYKEQNRGAYW